MPTRHSHIEISVLMPAYNAEQYILQSVQSVLGQTREDFELIVVDDASTDRTLDILSGIRDHRLRIIENATNLGVVASGNRAMASAAGRYVARVDADDYCFPTRFAKQLAFLDNHPDTMIVGTEMSVLKRGTIHFNRQRAHPDPQIVRWMLHLSNPVGNPSTMFRADIVDKLGEYLREPFQYAEDFDFSHRVLRLGDISVLPEHLVIYRQHASNLTLTRRSGMIARTTAVLRNVYADLLGPDQDDGAALVARHLVAGEVVETAGDFERLGTVLNALVDRFGEVYRLNGEQRHSVIQYAGKLWWQMIQQTLRAGRFADVVRHHGYYRWSRETRPAAVRLGRSSASGLLRRPLHTRPEQSGSPPPAVQLRLNDVPYQTVPVRTNDPPTLYVVVDTEAEFEWEHQFSRSATSVNAMSRQFLAQNIFDRYGVRPIYLVDYAVASQPEGYEPLRAILDRRGCVIGAHLHPWINPPFEEELSEFNSFAGNLPPDLEERKLRVLVDKIKEVFDIAPMFFKAGRYGIGPNTMAILDRAGILVDFSIMPMADMRRRGGPDFRSAGSQPYQVSASGLLSVPMTRGQLGLLASLGRPLQKAMHSDLSRTLRLPGILARSGLANTVTLTPEGVTAREQVQLIKAMLGWGQRTFVMHYHSPSLGKHTPYVRNDVQLDAFLSNIATVCRYFFDIVGGCPGNPADLVPQHVRDGVWPRQETVLPQHYNRVASSSRTCPGPNRRPVAVT